ncbi:RICIN domain-containing protein [Catenulispora yoronensis]
MVPAAVVTGAPAQASTGFVKIGIHGSGHCLDNATENNFVLQMWTCGGGSEQRWLEGFNSQTGTYTFTDQNTGWCITEQSATLTRVEMEPCQAPTPLAQQWRVFWSTTDTDGPYKIWQNAASNECLNTSSVGNGTLLRVFPCDLNDHYQKWDERS